MNPTLIRTVFFPIALATRGEWEYFRERHRLRSLEQGTLSLDAVASRRLSTVLAVASSTPYYRAAGVDASLGSDPARRLESFPVLTKSDLQANFVALQNPTVRWKTRKTTGGSTGQAVTVLKNPDAVARERAATAMGYGWFGIRMGDRAVRFWGVGATPNRRWRAALSDLAMNRRTVSAFAFDESDLERYWQLCLRFRPRYLYGYASMLEEFARYLDRRNLDGRVLKVRSVISTSEPLTAPRRSVLRQVFGVPVQNEYGCGEVGPIAYECPSGSLHVMSQNLWIEIISDDGDPCPPGVPGNVVITDLNNRALPLIRYAVGDRAALGSGCECSLPFPVLSEVLGRQYDHLEDTAGKRYHGEAVMYVFEDLRDDGYEIEAFQVLQHEPGQVKVMVVAPEAPSGLEARVTGLFNERLGGIKATVERCREIPRAASGKRRLIKRVG